MFLKYKKERSEAHREESVRSTGVMECYHPVLPSLLLDFKEFDRCTNVIQHLL